MYSIPRRQAGMVTESELLDLDIRSVEAELTRCQRILRAELVSRVPRLGAIQLGALEDRIMYLKSQHDALAMQRERSIHLRQAMSDTFQKMQHSAPAGNDWETQYASTATQGMAQST